MSSTTRQIAPTQPIAMPKWLTHAARRAWTYPEAGWLTVGLAVLVAAVVVWNVENARWVPVLPGLGFVVLVGGGAGLINATHRRSHLGQHAAALLIALAQAFAQTLTVVTAASIEGRGLSAIYRMTLWAEALLDGGASTDRLTFVFLLLAGSWVVAYLTVYLTLTLRSVWATLPAGFAIVTNLTYLPPSSLPWFMAFLLASALLIVRLVHLERRREWQHTSAAQGSWLPVHVMHAGIWFALIVFLLVTITPSLGRGPQLIRSAWSELRSPVGQAEGTFTRIFASLPARRSMGLFGFTNELPFRGNINLPKDVLMHVESDERLYWRARTYDRYAGWGWSNSRLIVDERRGLEDIAGSSYTGCPECIRNITFELKMPAYTVFTAATPLRTTLPVEAQFSNFDTDEGHRLVKLESRDVLQPNQRYTVQSYVPNVTVEELSVFEPTYEDWVTTRYLQLPDELPARISALAESLTAGAETPYQKAIIIREYLRTLEYSQDINAPPPGKDGLSHFLFEERAGYSEYFGSAMTVMLRSVGVPSRLAVGYLPGEYDPEIGAYVVRGTDLHSWADAYFPGYGWIPFEATPNVEPDAPGGPSGNSASLVSPDSFPVVPDDVTSFPFEDADLVGDAEGEALAGQFDEIDEGNGGLLPNVDLRKVMLYAGGIFGVTLLIGFAFLWWQALARPRTARRAYAQTVRLGRLAGIKTRADETPAEYISRLAVAIPSATWALYGVVHWYDHVLYGPDKHAPPDRPFSWRAIVFGLLTLALLRFVPTGRARMRGRTEDAG